ncbi:MAG: hypothetical protein MAG453_00933 [Calditrichaeota bacterium]|nr:hypothetical protein [Calditrichota bacterium]
MNLSLLTIVATSLLLAAAPALPSPPATATAELSGALVPEPVEARAKFLDALAHEDYIRAESIVDSLSSPELRAIRPWADLLRATLLATRAVDLGETGAQDRFRETVAAARRSFEVQLELAGDSLAARQRASLAYALGALDLLETQWANEVEGDALAAVGPARRGYSYMSRAVELDSTRLDALLGAAAYRFFRSDVLKFLAWTPFVRDEREQAIAQMRRVVETPNPSQPAAATALAWSLIEMDRPAQAAEVCEIWLAKLGEVRHLLEPCAKAYFVVRRRDEARALYDRYLEALRTAPVVNDRRLLGALNRAAQVAAEQGDWAGVEEYAAEALDRPLTESEWNELDDFRDAFEEYREQARRRAGDDGAAVR